MDDEDPDMVALGNPGSRLGTHATWSGVLTLYSDDAEMTSIRIVRFGFAVQGSMRSKPADLLEQGARTVAEPTLQAGGLLDEPEQHHRRLRQRSGTADLRVGQHGKNAGLIVQGSARHLAKPHLDETA